MCNIEYNRNIIIFVLQTICTIYMLTPKQESFCNIYLETGNASEAYRRSYCCDKFKEKSIWEKASQLLSDVKVRSRIRELQEILKEKSDLSKERILSELECILDAKITDYVELKNGILTFKDFSKLTEKQIRAIESVKEGRSGIELKLHGKSWTIERICKMLGYDAPEKQEASVHVAMMKPLTREDRKRIEDELESDY